MPALASNMWVVLRFVARPNGIWLAYLDSTGIRRDAPVTGAGQDVAVPRSLALPPIPLIQFPGTTWVAPDIENLLNTMVSRTSPRDALALFVEPPAALKGFPWEITVRHILPATIPANRFSIVRLGEGVWRKRPPLELPLRVLAVGTEAGDLLKTLEQSGWYGDEIRQHGLIIKTSGDDALAPVMQEEAQDVLVVGERGIEGALKIVQELRPALRPRLVLFAHQGPINWMFSGSINPPPETAFAEIAPPPPVSVDGLLREFFLQIIHDLPIHEAILAIQPLAASGSESLILANPASNHALRLSAAAPNTIRKVSALGSVISTGDVEAFVTRLLPETAGLVRDGLTDTLRSANVHDVVVRGAREFTDSLRIDFGGERRGLGPLAQAEARLAAARTAVPQLSSALAEVASNAAFASAIERVQKRQVVVELDGIDPFVRMFRPIDRYLPLNPGQEYRLNVYVGHRGQNNLVTGDVPSLDPLLPEAPDDAGHELEIAVFGKGFRVRSPRVQKVKLPRLGGTDPLYFFVHTPQEPRSAELRIGVYYRNNLLQSFRLEARVSPEQQYFPAPQVDVRLDFSRTTRLANLDQLKPREISIGLNHNVGTATHSFMVKKDDTAARPIHVSELAMKGSIDRFRLALKDETYEAKDKPRFSAYPLAGSETRAEFQRAVARFAKLGEEIYRFLHGRAGKELQARLDELRKASDKTIQIIRYDANYVFPWTAIYDYPLPATNTAPVCMGGTVKAAPPQPQGLTLPRGCPHRPGEDVFCIEGFWAVRHKIELMIDTGEDTIGSVDTATAGSDVCLAAGIDDGPAKSLAANLKAKFSLKTKVARFVEFSPPLRMEDLLWDPSKRPALLVLLSHMEEPRPAEFQLSLVSNDSTSSYYLTPAFIDRGKIAWKKWAEQPRTLVLLMACDSSATDLKTLNDFVTAFNAAGASAVVGTETEVFSGLAARFAEEVSLAMGRGASLGDAVQAFNRLMFRAGNPLVLAFTCCGNADLTLN